MSLTAQADFGLSLFREIATNDTTTVFAPISIAFALSMVHLGARGNTREQIKNAFCGEFSQEQCTMHYSSLMEQLNLGTQMTVANRLFAEIDILKSYEDELSAKLCAIVENVDFQNNPDEAAEVINKFVKTATNGNIDGVVTRNSFIDVEALAVNAVYFKGKFATPFSESSSRKETFFVKEEVTKEITLMHLDGKRFPFFDHKRFRAISLEYSNPSYRLTIILPKEKYGLADVIPQLNGELLKLVIRNNNLVNVNIVIPKFKIESDIEVEKALRNIGITDAFSPSADFSGMTGHRVRLGKTKHRAIMEVNEKETTAAAYTACKMVNISGIFYLEEPLYFVADHPFLFVLSYLDNVLFLGQYYG